jgi:hypothetical protein
MKIKQIPFSLEIVKKIQAGEIKGTILTREGRPARFLGEIKDPVYPLIFAIEVKHSKERGGAKERLDTYTLTGNYCNVPDERDIDIIVEIEDEQQESEYQFKPFDKVIVRDEENGYKIWQAAFYSHFYIGKNNDYHVTTAGDFYSDGEIIPYEGNEYLLGTNNKPKEE